MGEAPRPRSPPRYPDLCGRRRLQLEVQILNREVGFLEQEIQGLERIQPVSRCCKDVTEFVGEKADPMIPVSKRKHGSCSLYPWIRSKLHTCFSCLCCCLPKLNAPGCFGRSCCAGRDTVCCTPSCSCPKAPSCCGACSCKPGCGGHCQPPCSGCCSGDCSCAGGPCSCPRCCGCLGAVGRCLSSCCSGLRHPCCKCQSACCEGEPSCRGKGACCRGSCLGGPAAAPSCPECSCGCLCSCPRCRGGCRCPPCGNNPCCAGGCLC
ncbi:hypothetical protein PAHAL_6G226500 [Panicum hallii]|uniref:G protein gamma domain-containing protein n=1 Tax=Panicum hallii TaxID=206008 RepID=A0A2S3I2Z8_9POAL|nr:keratin-associated protein 5-4-like [Panicum hallii]PAN35684.1 hypothetical protein PAHAL_6G226500 [Panicum hallii]